MSVRNSESFTTPIYTVAEAARFLGVPPTTFGNWARGYRATFKTRSPIVGRPVVTALPADRNLPTIPFGGLAEAVAVQAFRKAGVSLQHIRRAVAVLEQEVGIAHALVSRRLFTDGASVLYDYAEREGDDELLTHVVTQQRVIEGAVREHLERIKYGHDGWPQQLVSPLTERPVVVADPRRSFGQPMFIRGSIRVEDVLDRWRAGETMAAVAEDFGIPSTDLEDYLRGAFPPAA